jgi:hypothetical protein
MSTPDFPPLTPSPSSNTKRAVRRRARQTKSPNRTPMTVMSQTEAFNLGLSRQTDSTSLRTKQIIVTALTTTPSLVIALTPGNFGARATGLAALFTNYRLRAIVLKFYVSTTSTSTSTGALGLLDDSSGAEGDGPTTIQGVVELRCSATQFTTETVPTIFNWSPIDKRKWFYTYPGASGSDPRLSVPAVLYGCTNTGTASISVELDCIWSFKGAADIGA